MNERDRALTLIKDLTRPGRRVGLTALLAAAVMVVIIIADLLPVIRASLESPSPAPEPVAPDKLAAGRRAFDEMLSRSADRVIARAPLGRIREAAPVQARPASPTRYGGPTLVGMADNSAWFSDGKRVRVGETGAGDLKVLALDPPWSAKVHWMGAEFTVTLFDRNPINLSQPLSAWQGAPILPPPASPPPAPPPQTAAPAPPGDTVVVVAGPAPGATPPITPPIPGPPPEREPRDEPPPQPPPSSPP